MAEWTERAALLFKPDGLEKLQKAKVLVVGLGGVGSFAAEFLVRAGVGKLTIVDGDTVDITNINRQLPALHSTIGEPKVKIVGDRLMDINPELNLIRIEEFLSPERASEIVTTEFDYVLDCIDSLTPKITFLKLAYESKVKVVSSMGAGAKLDPTKLQVVDISKTYNCPFAQQVRKMLKQHEIRKGIKVVFSPENPIKESLMLTDGKNFKKSAYGTISYLPAVFGAVAASVVIRDLIGEKI